MSEAKFVWNELGTPDAEGAREFYTRLLGWAVKENEIPGMGTYYVWQSAGNDVGGMFQLRDDQLGYMTPHWLSYIGVEDVDAHAARVPMLGGKVHVPPTDIPGIGRFCVIGDPAGAMIALITPSMDG